MLTWVVLSGSILAGVAGLTAVFYGFARLFRAGMVTKGRAVGTAAAILPMYIASTLLLRMTTKPALAGSGLSKAIASSLESLFVLALLAGIAKVTLKSAWWRATLALVLTWVLAGLPSQFLFTRYLGTGYAVTSNSMAPTLRGWHTIERCPKCQGPLIVPAQPPGPRSRDLSPLGICERCWKVSRSPRKSRVVRAPEMFFALKFLTAKRWDIVIYNRPDGDSAHPPIVGVARIVGMPTESVEIREHALWINGAPADLPPEVKDIHYHSSADHHQPGTFDAWLTNADEFVLLGDFTEISSDSRFYGCVPRRNIVGVITARRGEGSRTTWWQ